MAQTGTTANVLSEENLSGFLRLKIQAWTKRLRQLESVEQNHT